MADAVTTIMGPTPCRDCTAPVSVVRLAVEVLCNGYRIAPELDAHTHDILAWTVVDADGERHLCPVDTARYDADSEEVAGTSATDHGYPLLLRSRIGV